MIHRLELYRRLAGAGTHAPESLARELGIGVRELAGEIEGLRERGLPVDSLHDGRVRLRSPMEALDRDAVLSGLGGESRLALEKMEIFFEVESTNQYLLDLAREDEAPRPRACLAETQSAGRGRGGRSFHSTPGGSVLLSLLWPVALPPAELMGLSPALGVTVAGVLESEGVEGVALKWPNDVLVRGRKVSGILLELGQDRRGCGVLVAGVGINVGLDQATARVIDQPWTDLHRSLGRTPSRSRIAGKVMDRMVHAMRLYMERGFEAFRSPYRERDWLRGKALRVEGAPRELLGIGRGVDERGALLVEEQGRVTALLSGDVSVRAAP